MVSPPVNARGDGESGGAVAVGAGGAARWEEEAEEAGARPKSRSIAPRLPVRLATRSCSRLVMADLLSL